MPVFEPTSQIGAFADNAVLAKLRAKTNKESPIYHSYS